MTNINCYLLQGDSGGPLVCERPGGQWTLFGLTSWGSVCFSKVLGPGVYSNVSYFVEWIERQIYIKTFLQKEFQGWAESLPATYTKHVPLDHEECPAKSCTDGLSWAGCSTCPARSLVCTRSVLLSLFSPALSFINFMNSFQNTEHSRFCSFPRLTLNVVWKYQLCRDIWGSMVTSDRKFLFVLS